MCKNSKKVYTKNVRKSNGLGQELNPGPRAPEARIIPLGHQANSDACGSISIKKYSQSLKNTALITPALTSSRSCGQVEIMLHKVTTSRNFSRRVNLSFRCVFLLPLCVRTGVRFSFLNTYYISRSTSIGSIPPPSLPCLLIYCLWA